MERDKTSRGFDIIRFTDRYGEVCSLQKSSLAFEDCIWLGVSDPAPKILAKDAAALGIPTKETTGWIDYPTPEGVSIASRMHLSQEMAAELIPILKKFVETGEI